MTQCDGTPAERCLESYVQGGLSEVEARRFEDHYFDCPVCLAQVEALQAVAMRLEEVSPAATKQVIAWPVRWVAMGAIAATLVLSLVGFRMTRHPSSQGASAAAPAISRAIQPTAAAAAPSAPAELVSLADLSLPVYQAPHLRGIAGSAEFVAGMQAYSRHDCADAIHSLAKVAAASDEALAAKFYSGECEMSLGQRDVASSHLQRVAGAGDSPEQEAALYSLAQLALARGDAATAERELTRTIALHGNFERRASAELEKVRQIEGRS